MNSYSLLFYFNSFQISYSQYGYVEPVIIQYYRVLVPYFTQPILDFTYPVAQRFEITIQLPQLFYHFVELFIFHVLPPLAEVLRLTISCCDWLI